MAIGADFTRSLLTEAGIGPGMRVLDAGCGAGDVSFELARLVGPNGSVLGVDRNEIALRAATTTAKELGLAQLAFAVADLAALPPEVGTFDAVVGRRVLMYLPDPAASVAALSDLLRPGGTMVFHEHDLAAAPNVLDLPLHDRLRGWVRKTVLAEGAHEHMGFALAEVTTRAGLEVLATKVEAVVQTPQQPYPLDWLVQIMRNRIIVAGVATEAELDDPDLIPLLDEERQKGTWLADLMFGVIARKR